MPCFTHDLSMSADYYDHLQRWMLATGQIEELLDPTGYWAREMVL